MKNLRQLGILLGTTFGIAGIGIAAPASAQATRTWVSGVGDDVNPCSRTAPCKTFAGAIPKTAPGGEINCLDPGAFGAVTINKALSIICQYTEAGVLATLGSNGIVVNAQAADHVYLSGLDINGAGTGLNGIRFIAGASLTIENSIIRGFGAANGNGVSFQPSGASRLNINNTTINFNGAAGTGNGILVQPTGAGGSARVSLDNVRVQSNNNNGLRVDTTGDTNVVTGIAVVVQNSEFSNQVNGISVNVPAATSAVNMLVNGSDMSNNTGTAVAASGSANATIRVGTSTITANGTGVNATGGAAINTFGNNQLINNTSNGAFNGAPIPPA